MSYAAYAPGVCFAGHEKRPADLVGALSEVALPAFQRRQKRNPPSNWQQGRSQPSRRAPANLKIKQSSIPQSIRKHNNSVSCFCMSPGILRVVLSAKFTIYGHQTFGPPCVIFCQQFRAGIGMANTTKLNPREWRTGPGPSGRLYGDSLATVTSSEKARFLTGVVLQEEDQRNVRFHQ